VSRYRLRDGTIVETEELSVVGGSSRTVELDLSDGSRMTVTLNVLRVLRCDERKDDLGQPTYLPVIQTLCTIKDIPKNLHGPVPLTLAKPPLKRKGEPSEVA